jgi:hypothetical protein
MAKKGVNKAKKSMKNMAKPSKKTRRRAKKTTNANDIRRPMAINTAYGPRITRAYDTAFQGMTSKFHSVEQNQNIVLNKLE